MRESAYLLTAIFRRLAGSVQDLAPIVLVIAFFQIVVIQQPFPNLWNVIVGLACVVVGLALFIQGLESGLFPIGEALAQGFARKGSVIALLAFAFCLGFSTTIAEPALIAVAGEAAAVAAEAGVIQDNDAARDYLRPELAPGRGLRRRGRHSVGRVSHSEGMAHPLPDHRGLPAGDRHDRFRPP